MVAGRRSSTENVAGIVGMGAACELAVAQQKTEAERLGTLRDEMEAVLRQEGALIFGGEAERLSNTSLFGFPSIEGESMVVMLDQSGFAVASGAACSSMKEEPSHVLLAMGTPLDTARTAVRVSLGAATSAENIARFVSAAVSLRQQLGAMSSVCGD
jgi:cysteine desulfurase